MCYNFEKNCNSCLDVYIQYLIFICHVYSVCAYFINKQKILFVKKKKVYRNFQFNSRGALDAFGGFVKAQEFKFPPAPFHVYISPHVPLSLSLRYIW